MTNKEKISLGIAVGAAAVVWFLERKLTASPASGIGAARGQKKFYVYAGYYENLISSKPLPAPYILRRTFRSIDAAINYAESFGDHVTYCDNVKYDLPDYLYDALQENNEFAHIDGCNGTAYASKNRILANFSHPQLVDYVEIDPTWTKGKYVNASIYYSYKFPDNIWVTPEDAQWLLNLCRDKNVRAFVYDRAGELQETYQL